MIAKATVDAGAFAEAEADYAEAAKRDPSNPEPLVLLANERLEWCGLLQSRGRDDPAIRARVIEEMTALLAREPPPPRAWLIRGQALTQRGTLAVAAGRPGLDDLGAAMRDYDAYLKAHPGDRLGRLFRTHALCESALAVGGEEGSTRFAEAVAEYSDLLARSPGDATIVKLRADARVNWAGNRAALKLDSIPLLREAIADYSEVIRQSPGQPRAWFGRGAARKNLALRSKSADDERDALIDFLKAVELDPDYVDALVEAGRIHERRASIASKEGRSPIPDADAAIPYLERALRLARDNAGAWRALGHARMFRAQGLLGARKIADDDLRAAAAAYEAALALRPDYNDARINLETCRRLLKRE
jgi:tetratricopeptide (TPR) repeat protein